MKKTNETKNILFLMLTAVVPIIGISLYRLFFMDGLFPGKEAYKNLLITEKLSNEATPYHFILNYFSGFFDLQLFSQISSLLFGIITVILFYLIIKELFDEEISLAAAVILALSPAFIGKFSIPSTDAFFAIILLASIFMIIKNNPFYLYVIIPSSIMVSFFGFFHLIIYIFSCMIFLFKLNNKKAAIIVFFVALLSGIVFYKPWYFNLIKEPFLIHQNTLSQLIADSGNINGIGFFSLLLALAGISFTWKEDKDRYILHHIVFFLVLLLSVFYYSNLTFYLNFLVCLLASIGLIKFYRMKWKMGIIKKATLWFMIYGLIFSLFLNISLISKEDPNPDLKKAIVKLQGISLSDPSYGYWIEYYSDSEPYSEIDSNSKNYNYKLNRTKEIFNSRNLEKTKSIMKEENINTLLIDSRMKENLWRNENSGILFVLNNSRFMTKSYENKNAVVWEIR